MFRIQASFIVGALLCLAAPRSALAAGDEPTTSKFGDSGQFALQLNEGMTVTSGDLLAGPQIQASYFVVDHLSLGLMLGANGYSTSAAGGSASSHEVVFRIGPRVGYDLAISDSVSFWPQVGVDFRSDSQSTSAVSGTLQGGATPSSVSSTVTTSAFAIVVVAPIVIHPTRGFFVGAGPSFYTELSSSTGNDSGGSSDNGKVTSLGLTAMIGGAL